jgi:hypothetical protein
LQVALKAADLSHLCDLTESHIRWVSALEEEFFQQGDAEKAAGLPISPLFDRTKPGVTKSQVAFLDIVVVPLFQVLAEHLPATEPFLARVSGVIAHVLQLLILSAFLLHNARIHDAVFLHITSMFIQCSCADGLMLSRSSLSG